MQHPLSTFLSGNAVIAVHRPILRLMHTLNIPTPTEAAIVLEQIAYRMGGELEPVVYTVDDAENDVMLPERSFRRVITALRDSGLLTITRRIADGGGNVALYAVDMARLTELLPGDWAGTEKRHAVSAPAAPAKKAAKPDHSATATAVLEAYNTNRGSLPAASLTSTRVQTVGRLLKNHPTVDLPEALGIATRVVSKNTYWQEQRYGFDNLLAKDNWVKYYESARSTAERPAERRGLLMPDDVE